MCTEVACSPKPLGRAAVVTGWTRPPVSRSNRTTSSRSVRPMSWPVGCQLWAMMKSRKAAYQAAPAAQSVAWPWHRRRGSGSGGSSGGKTASRGGARPEVGGLDGPGPDADRKALRVGLHDSQSH
eukprot:10420433-Alexandrium_andersonii.AAC.1